MGELVDADDELPAEGEVGEWVTKKHQILVAYLDLQSLPRRGFLGPGKRGATYIDLFCGPGRARIKGTNEFVDGSAVVAWKASVDQKAPFSSVFVADKDEERRIACAERLRRLGAPVIEIRGDAQTAASEIAQRLDPYGLHFAFVDPYSLGALKLDILRTLMRLNRMDLMVHISAMDLFRNLDFNLMRSRTEFDEFAPGWLENVDLKAPDHEQRRALVNHWKSLIDSAGFDATAEMKPIRNSANRDLYWLLVLSRHRLAKKFWGIVVKYDEPQKELGF
jgi:three-Cys-motif partner protein